jgi:5'-nucleotidase/UDP-sugar diphosphatase
VYKHIMKYLALNLLFIFSILSSSVFANTILNIIHINDHHSHLESEPYKLFFDGVETKVQLGGLPRVATKIKQLRTSLKNPLVLHAGDALQGTIFYTLYKGDADVALMNMIGFDAFELGNHEFDDGETVLAKFIKQANFPILAANIDASQNNEIAGLFKPYLIKEIEGEQVAILGINTLKTVDSSNPNKNVIFKNEIKTANKYVKLLEKQGINKIFLLSHYGYNQDINLAKQVAGVDIIVGGDSHTLLGDVKSLGLKSEGDYPTIVLSPRKEPVCIVQAWQYSYAVGKLKVEFNENGQVTKCQGNSILLVDSINQKVDSIIANNSNIEIVKEDSAVAAKLAEYSSKLENLRQQVIGQAADNLWHIRIPGTHATGVELPNGSYIAPIVAESFFYQLQKVGLKPDLVIENGGGIRTSLLKGNITIDHAYNLLPFNNTLYILNMKGSEIKQVLEDAVSHIWDDNGSTGAFPYGSHIRYTIEKNKPTNQRITQIEIKNKQGIWQAIKADKYYKVVTNSYLTDGKDGYTTFGKIKAERGGINTYFNYAESFVDYVKQIKTLTIPQEFNVRFYD